jgi:hypothetical protein
MIGEITHGIAKRYEHVEVGKRTQDSTPQQRPAPDLASRRGLTDGGT